MSLFTPSPIAFELFDPIDEDWVRVITRWPGQTPCARIEVRRMDEVFVKEAEEYGQ